MLHGVPTFFLCALLSALSSFLQVVINCGALNCLLNLLTANHKKSIKKEACWTISNITAGTKEQIQAVIDSQLVSPLVHLLGVSAVQCSWPRVFRRVELECTIGTVPGLPRLCLWLPTTMPIMHSSV